MSKLGDLKVEFGPSGGTIGLPRELVRSMEPEALGQLIQDFLLRQEELVWSKLVDQLQV